MLVYAQHILSGGITAYNPLIGAVIITFVLGIVSILSASLFTNNFFRIPALYHLPSMLVLASLTDINIVEDASDSVTGKAWIASIIIFVLLLAVNRMIKGLPRSVHFSSVSDIFRDLAINVGVIIGMIAMVFGMANTNDIDHEMLRQEVLISKDRYDEVLSPFKKQNFSNDHLTTLRAFALAKTNGIGEHFFEYPVNSNSDALLPSENNPMLVVPEKQIFKFIGGKPAEGMKARRCLQILKWRNQLSDDARDYLYLAFLLDKDLDGFVNCLAKDSVNVKTLPKHYREALTLYNHLRTQPEIDYSMPEMDTDYDDFEALKKKNHVKLLRENALRESYGNTYWYYYFKEK